MIVFDTETTGLPLADTAPLEKQPQICEFAAIKLNDDTLEEISRIEFLCKPSITITAEMASHNGITQEMVKDMRPFGAHIKDLQNFFLGEKYMVAHNVAFDRSLLTFELRRLAMLTRFPWPPNHICTVEQTMFIKGHKMKLIDIYEHAFGERFEKAHRAINDTQALVRIIRWCKEQKKAIAA